MESNKISQVDSGSAAVPGQIFTVIVTDDYEGNRGDPVGRELFTFSNEEEAKANYKKELAEITNENGVTRTVELFEGDEEEKFQDEISSDCCESQAIPENSIVVYYRHHRYMNYSFDIVNVKDCEFTTVDELPYSKDHTTALWCNIYENLKDLYEEFINGHGIFEKINSGGGIIEDFLCRNGFEVGEQEVIYDVVIKNGLPNLITVDSDENAKYRITCTWDPTEVSKGDVKGIVEGNLAMGGNAFGTVRDGQWNDVNIEIEKL